MAFIEVHRASFDEEVVARAHMTNLPSSLPFNVYSLLYSANPLYAY